MRNLSSKVFYGIDSKDIKRETGLFICESVIIAVLQ